MPTGKRDGTRGKATFRAAAFDALAEPLGLRTITEKAEFVGATRSAFSRAYNGKRGAGGKFVGLVLNAPWGRPVTYSDFFGDEAAA